MNLLDALTDAALLTTQDRQGDQAARNKLQAALKSVRDAMHEAEWTPAQVVARQAAIAQHAASAWPV